VRLRLRMHRPQQSLRLLTRKAGVTTAPSTTARYRVSRSAGSAVVAPSARKPTRLRAVAGTNLTSADGQRHARV
jgi:hypothetical protein